MKNEKSAGYPVNLRITDAEGKITEEVKARKRTVRRIVAESGFGKGRRKKPLGPGVVIIEVDPDLA